MNQTTFINVKEIEDLYREFCNGIHIRFTKKKFDKFIKFLEIDFYDWVRGNLRYFNIENNYKIK